MHMKNLIFLTLIAAAACSPELTVFSDSDPDYDLSVYNTFGWAERPDGEAEKYPLRYNELNDKRIKTAVEQQMRSRGYVATPQQPNLLIRYHIVVDETAMLVPEPFGYVYGPFWMRAGTQAYYYRQGTLIIDLIDNSTKSLVWRGWASTNADEVKPGKVDKVIRHAVEKIFRKFPATARGPASTEGIVSN